MNACAETEQELVAAERVLQYSKRREKFNQIESSADNYEATEQIKNISGGIETETSADLEIEDGMIEPPYGWPVHGVVEFQRVYFRYRYFHNDI